MGMCPICQKEGATGPTQVASRDAQHFDCPRCGRFIIDGTALITVPEIDEQQRFMLSAVLRAASDGGRQLEITTYNVRSLIDSAPRWASLFDGVDRLMLLLANRAKRFTTPVHFDKQVDYPLLCAKGDREMNDLLIIAGKLDFIDVHHSTITVGGWRRIDELRRVQSRARQAFVAMSFAPGLSEAWTLGIKPGIEDTHYYTPFRVDTDEHNDKIDDRIIAGIKRSGLVVADFTGQRGGVYFEAGFALGLGIPVIWTCRVDEVATLHFDTRQYNHIAWETPAELRRRLTDRIMATVVPRDAV